MMFAKYKENALIESAANFTLFNLKSSIKIRHEIVDVILVQCPSLYNRNKKKMGTK